MKMLGIFCLCFLLCGVQSELRNVKDDLEKQLQNLNNLLHGHSTVLDGLLAQLHGHDHTHLEGVLQQIQHYVADGNHPNVDSLVQHIQHLTHQRKRDLVSSLQHSAELVQQALQHLGDHSGGLLDALTHELQGVHLSLTNLLAGDGNHPNVDNLVQHIQHLTHQRKRDLVSSLQHSAELVQQALQHLGGHNGGLLDALTHELQGVHLSLTDLLAGDGNHPNVDNLVQHIQHLTHQRKRDLVSSLQHSTDLVQQALHHLGDHNGGLLDALTHELQGVHLSLTDLLNGGADHLLHNLNNLAHHDKRSILDSLQASIDKVTGIIHQVSGQASGGGLLETLSQQLGGAKQTLATLLASSSESLQGLNHNVVETLGQVHNGLVGGAHQVIDTLLHPQSK